MAIFRDEVTVLKSRDLGEYDRILILFGKRRGKFSVVAKGVRKLTSRKSGHLQTFCLCKVACAEGRSLDIIVDAEEYFSIDGKNIPVDEFARIGLAGRVMDKFLPEGVPDMKIYGMWTGFIQGRHSLIETKDFVVGVIDLLGFVSSAHKKAWDEVEEDKISIDILQKWVERILNSI